jgi:hypothetical protein
VFDFGFNAIDQVSGPMKAMEQATRGLRDGLKSTDHALHDLDRSQRNLQIASLRGMDITREQRAATRQQLQALQAQRLQLVGQRADMAQNLRTQLDATDALHRAHVPVTSIAEDLAPVAGGFAAVAAAATAAGAAIAAAGFAAGSFVVEQAQFQENTMTTLRTLLGTDKDARDEFARSLRLAEQTPFSMQDVVRARTQLVSAGFTDARDRDVLFAGMSDLAAMNPGDSTVMSRAATAIAQIQAAGRANMQDIGQLRNAGLNQGRLFQNIGRLQGVHGSEAQIAAEVQRRISAGRVDSATTLRALVDTIQGQAGGGPLGTLTLRQSQNLTGVISNLKDAFSALLLRLDFENIPGFQAFKGFLSNVVSLLSAANPIGQRLQTIMRRLIDSVFGGLFGPLSGPGGARTLERVFGGVLDVVEGVEGAVRAVLPYLQAFGGGFLQGLLTSLEPLMRGMRDVSGTGPSASTLKAFTLLGQVLGYVLGSVVTLGAEFATLLARIDAFATRVDGLRASGVNVAGGLAQGIRSALPAPVQAAASMAEGVVGAVTTALDMHSPSRVLEGLGEMTVAGFERGLQSGGGMAGLLDGAVPAPRARGAGGAGVQIAVHVDARGATADDAQAIADASVSRLLAVFEGLEQLGPDEDE